MSKTGNIAVVGASSARHKFGNKCVRAYAEAGWNVYPIHPTETEIEGLPAYPEVARVPVELDRVTHEPHPHVWRLEWLLPCRELRFCEKDGG